MSALGQKRTLDRRLLMSALPPKGGASSSHLQVARRPRGHSQRRHSSLRARPTAIKDVYLPTAEVGRWPAA
jgi:hypothetical protein